MTAAGARPAGTIDEATASDAVREMFDSIAPRYDLLNHLFSANVDRLWWYRAAHTFESVLARPESEVLDICCGTGDLTMALLKLRPRGAQPVLAADFAPAMLRRGAQKFAATDLSALTADHGVPHAIPIQADALHLPMRTCSLDLVVTAFGFRNLANYTSGLREFHRVLKPGGRLGILDFSEPDGIVGAAYAFYFRQILPAIGKLICGRNGPYNYLPASVGKFPPPPSMLTMMRSAGYAECAWRPFTFGIAGLYTAVRPF